MLTTVLERLSRFKDVGERQERRASVGSVEGHMTSVGCQ